MIQYVMLHYVHYYILFKQIQFNIYFDNQKPSKLFRTARYNKTLKLLAENTKCIVLCCDTNEPMDDNKGIKRKRYVVSVLRQYDCVVQT